MYSLDTPDEVALDLAQRMKSRRLALAWKQQTLAERSGVSLASLRRFEKSGLISLESLLKLAFALDHLDDFEHIFKAPLAQSLKDLEVGEDKPQRGRL
ncbi:helix-turn-helix transcriptional regulator [Lentisphaera marina]|uniref:helix-turn-helix domain-containing protein n=1 Tax=Lentisphaera marina TaxID=1111041 RepID=UPI0023653A72|nr:helix-turn-helix transcriptional regulator [Lentisphaera marina]MDD7987199.1 helix-turn-helix transcriptional regulator [Lentisphaera marina]